MTSPVTSFLNPQNYILSASTMSYSAQIVDLAGVPISSVDLATLTLSIVDIASGTFINSVHSTNIKNTGRGTIDTSGNLVITLTPADTTLYSSTNTFEVRALIIDWTYGGGLTGRHQVNIGIKGAAGTQPD